MAHQYSKALLHRLRNQVDVAELIRDVLRLPTSTHHGIFRFRCPGCNGFDCTTNYKTNLARCFHCQRNFNPIDLVMTVNNSSFVDAVDFLALLLPPDKPPTHTPSPRVK